MTASRLKIPLLHNLIFFFCLDSSVAVSPGDQLLHPEKKKTKRDRDAEEDQVDSARANRENSLRNCRTILCVVCCNILMLHKADGTKLSKQNNSVADMCEWRACEIMAELVEGLQSILSLGHRSNSMFPAFLTPTLRNIVISLSRLPLVNSFTRVPPLVSV